MAGPLMLPRLRRGQATRRLAGARRFFRVAALRSHELQLIELLGRMELLDDACAGPAALPLLRARLAEVQAELAALQAHA